MEAKCRSLELSPISESSLDDTTQHSSWASDSSPRKLVLSSPQQQASPAQVPSLQRSSPQPSSAVSSKRAFFEAMICSTAGVKVCCTSRLSCSSCSLCTC